ncbi:GNAT family N-acetyltransferase [Polyangium spumosum]|uniref:GNAT family N-acetyltransferase n=1 Tax=Polyangium spumosum TaxID=889282 RepID=A0A6N7PNA7_9BACT|nr:GNAT family N-acetyltransferase [Polyangium spumosum]MRG93642.1 GNAT family N-acetyltransferase [Polyangium spumosum]
MVSFTPFPTLETPRLVLRELVPADVETIFRIQSNPKVVRYFGRPAMTTIAEAEAKLGLVFDAMRDGTGVRWGLSVKEGGALAGTCGFWRWDKDHRHAEIGYELAPEFWGKGLMVEALRPILRFGFTRMELHRVEANIDPANQASRRVLEKLGFKRDALMRENWLYDGKFTDSAIYGLLDREYLNQDV